MSVLLPNNLSLLKRMLFKTFHSIHSKHSSHRIKFFSHMTKILVKLLQYLSVIILSDSKIKNFSHGSTFTSFMKIPRLDLIFVELGLQNTFHLLIVGIISINLLSIFLITIQIKYKKRFCLYFLVLLAKISNWIRDTLFLIPLTMYSMTYLKNFIIPTKEDNSNFKVSLTLLPGILALLIAMFVLKFFDILFETFPKYCKRGTSRLHSVVEIRVVMATFLFGISGAFFNPKYSLFTILVLAGVNCYSYLYYLPYCSLVLNKFNVFTWGIVLVSCFLVLISQSYDNFFIVQINFPFLFIALGFLINSVISKRLELVDIRNESNNPYAHELKLRKFLIYSEQDSNMSEFIFKHYKFANKHFRNFSLQYVWESIILKKFLKDKELALLKLVKISAIKINPQSSSFNTKISLFSTLYDLETEFLLFSLFKSQTKKIPSIKEDTMLIKYCTYLKQGKNLDEEILNEILKFIQSISDNSEICIIESRIKIIGNLIKSYKQLSKTLAEKFGVDKKFLKIFATFLKNIMNSDKGNQLLERFGNMHSLGDSLFQVASDYEINNPIVIISGWYENIGTIIYANPALYSLLKITMEKKLIGKKFTTLIPQPFDSMHNDVLLRFLFEKNSCTLTRDHLFLIDSQKHCIEVTMQLRIGFYRRYPYFIAKFKKLNTVEKNFIVCIPDGTVVSKSSEVEKFFPELGKNLFDSFSELGDLLQTKNNEEIFDFVFNHRIFHIKKESLDIDGYEFLIVNFIDGHTFDKKRLSFIYEKIKEPNILKIFGENEHKFYGFKDKEFIKTNTLEVQRQKSNNKLELHRAKKFAKCLRITFWITIISEIILTLTVLFVILNIINSILVSQIIFDIGLMRYLSCSILSNTFSLELLSHNITIQFNESFYRLGLAENSARLKVLIDQYREIQMPFINSKKSYFSSTTLEMHRYINSSFTSYDDSLLNAIQTMVIYSSKIANTSISSFSELYEEKMFILRNIPSTYTNVLNETVMSVMYDLISSLEKSFNYLSAIEILCIFPPVLLIFVSIICFYAIEKTNRTFWSVLFINASKNMVETRGKIISRLSLLHEDESIYEDFSQKEKKAHYKSITLKPFLKIFCLLLISLGFYLSITYGPQYLLQEMMKNELIHTNFGGLRRMLTPLTLFWGRNSILFLTSNQSYESLMDNYQTSSSLQELQRRVDQMLYIQTNLMNSLKNPVETYFGFREYKQLMYEEACDIITTLPNCTGTIAKYGLNGALNFYASELVTQTNMYKNIGFRPNMLVSIEKYSKVVERSFVFGLFVYANYTNQVVENLKNQLVFTSGLFLVVVIMYSFLIFHKLTDGIIKNLEEKEEILQVFTEKQESKGNPPFLNNKMTFGKSKQNLNTLDITKFK